MSSRLLDGSMSVMAMLQQQSFEDTANSTAFIDLPFSPT
jgi:hypothetical protein